MDSTSTSDDRRATRSSLACLTCRLRHLKCDGKRPYCDRCSEEGKQCSYAQSRRGGPDRAALAERRKRLAAVTDPRPVIRTTSRERTLWQHQNPAPHIQVNLCDELRFPDIIGGDGTTGSSVRVGHASHPSNIGNDPLINSYYKTFHICHPFILPKNHLTKLYQDQSRQQGFAPLIAALRFLGNIYQTREWSIRLKELLETFISQMVPSDPILVQCRLLYSIALFWYEYEDDAKLQMALATKLAIDLQMFRHEFAAAQGAHDLVLRESWRRTWWMLYVVDVYYAGTLGSMNLEVVHIDATMELPCDELDYESGVSVNILRCGGLMSGPDESTAHVTTENTDPQNPTRIQLPRIWARELTLFIVRLSDRRRTVRRICHVYNTAYCCRRRLDAHNPFCRL